MAEPFRASFIKIERAQHHLQELEKIVEEYIASNPAQHSASVGTLVDGRITVQMNANLRGMPEVAGAVIGDIIHPICRAILPSSISA